MKENISLCSPCKREGKKKIQAQFFKKKTKIVKSKPLKSNTKEDSWLKFKTYKRRNTLRKRW